MVLEHLSNATTSVVVADGNGAPNILYWGTRLPEHTDLNDLVLALQRGRPHGTMDEPDPLTLVPEHARGFAGHPGISGMRPDGTSWAPRFESISLTRQGTSIVAESIDRVAGLALRCEISLDDALTASVELSNIGNVDYWLSELDVTLPVPGHATELVTFDGRWAREMQPHRRRWDSGTTVLENRRGRTSHDRPSLLIAGSDGFNEWTGEVWAAHLAWSGNHVARAEVLADGRRYLQVGELLSSGEVCLEPGTSYRSPTVVASHSTRGLTPTSWGFHRYVRLAQGTATRPRRVLINTWEAVYFDHSPDRLRALADIAAACGVELFVLDDGWFSSRRSDRAGLGDWWVSSDVYPNGLGPLISHVRALGMDFGIWVEPEMVNPESELYRQHPDWVLATDGYPRALGRNQLLIDLTNPGAYAHILLSLDRLLTDHDITFVKWDMNRDQVQASDASGRAATHRQTLALYSMLDELRERHPDVEFESCASGGGRIDLGVLRHTDRVWTSDTNDPLERQRIQRSLSILLPHEVMGCHIGPPRAHTTGRSHSLAFRAATALFGHLGIEWNLLDATERDLEEISRAVSLHKRFRYLLHHGDAIRVEHPDTSIVAHGVYDAERTEALISVARMDTASSPHGAPLRLPDLGPNIRYRVNFVHVTGSDPTQHVARAQPDWVEHGITLTGTQLAAHGLQLPVLWPETAVMVHVARELE